MQNKRPGKQPFPGAFVIILHPICQNAGGCQITQLPM